ncbi:MAG: LysM peptidoglycan-binding domain-containing protein [Deltaproteobacteria bacterium]|nr:LysM peptidoglycan-binding domain-containing protein [Deltaproteobacteria bacterium]
MLGPLLALLAPLPLSELEVVRAFDEQMLAADLGPLAAPSAPLSFNIPRELTSQPVQVFVLRTPPLPPLKSLTLPISLNAQVLSYLEFFQGRGRATFAKSYSRMGRYEELITQVLDKHKLPPELIYLAMIESGFQNDAVSTASAVGLWQFVRRTGDSYGLRYDAWVDERRDFIASTDAAARHLRDLYDHFKSYNLALAAYNAGIGTVTRAVTRVNSNDLFTLHRYGHLQGAAGVYVPKILAAMIIGQDPGLYGFHDLKKEPPLTFEEVEVPGGLDLGTYARHAKVERADLELLNPALRRGYVPPDANGYTLRVPVGAGAPLEAALKQLELKQPQLFYEHKVRFGETLSDIAYRYGVSKRSLRQINDLPDGRLEAGALLLAPQSRRVTAPRDPLSDALLVAIDPQLNFSYPRRQLVYFPVRQPMSVESVASFFRVAPSELSIWNSVDPEATLQKGMALRLYLAEGFDLTSALLVTPEQVQLVAPGAAEGDEALSYAERRDERQLKQVTHVVRSGQTLRAIAERYGVTPEDIRAESGLRRTTPIYAGLKLTIPASATPGPSGAAARAAAKREGRRPAGLRASPRGGRRAAPRRYTVREGDTLWKIAQEHGVSVERLRAVNALRGRVRLSVGQTLEIPP